MKKQRAYIFVAFVVGIFIFIFMTFRVREGQKTQGARKKREDKKSNQNKQATSQDTQGPSQDTQGPSQDTQGPSQETQGPTEEPKNPDAYNIVKDTLTRANMNEIKDIDKTMNDQNLGAILTDYGKEVVELNDTKDKFTPNKWNSYFEGDKCPRCDKLSEITSTMNGFLDNGPRGDAKRAIANASFTGTTAAPVR